MHACTHTSIHPSIHPYIHTYIHFRHTHTHASIYIYICIHSYISSYVCYFAWPPFYDVDLVSPGVVENLVRSSWLSHRGTRVRACTRHASKIQRKRLLGSAGDLWLKGVWSNLRGYKYAIYTSRWYVRNYVRIVVQDGDHWKKSFVSFSWMEVFRGKSSIRNNDLSIAMFDWKWG